MSEDTLIVRIELQLCLSVASTHSDMKTMRGANDSADNGTPRAVRPFRNLQLPVPMPYGLFEVSSSVRESSMPA